MGSQFVSCAVIASLALVLASCGGGDPLDYETALNLMRDRATEPVKTSFSATPRSENEDPKVAHAYGELVDAHVILCKPTGAVGTICEPGPAGEGLSQLGVSEISLVAGRWVPASIVAIQRAGRDSATADVRMSFQPSPIFKEFENAFDVIQAPNAMITLGGRKEGKMVRVTFQRYQDGWHIETVQ